MEFKKLSVGTYRYGETHPTPDKQRLKAENITNVSFSDPVLQRHMTDVTHENF
jgi:hypothetical protein